MTPRPPTSTLFPYTTLFRSNTISFTVFPEIVPSIGNSFINTMKKLLPILGTIRSEERFSRNAETDLVCRLLLEKKKKKKIKNQKMTKTEQKENKQSDVLSNR